MNGLVLWISWVNDCLVAGKDEAVLESKASVINDSIATMLVNSKNTPDAKSIMATQMEP